MARGLRNRLLVVLVPVHLVAFAALYLGVTATVSRELLGTHATDARMLVDQAIRDLPPYMACRTGDGSSGKLTGWSEAHHLMALELYGSNGDPVTAGAAPDPQVREFLDGTDDDRFSFAEHENTVTLNGLVRIRSTAECSDCHAAGAVLGAASMKLDLTGPVWAARRRIRRDLAMLVVGWSLIVGFVNLALTRWAKRSLATLNGDVASSAGEASTQIATLTPNLSRVPSFPVDPVASEIYASLRELLKQKAHRDREVDDRLRHQQRLASLGQMAAGLAHEIKNPLSGIHGVLELLRDDAPDADHRDLYIKMLSELDRVNTTIHSLLSFARPATLTKVATDVGALLESSVQLQRPALAAREISIRVEVASDVPEVCLDHNLIRQAIVNLVVNSADAIGQRGNIVITAVTLPDDRHIVVSVADDGPGISPQHRERVTEPFFTTKFTGTGLGLAVVREIVTAHGGSLEIQSSEGRGTTAFLVLPADGGGLAAASVM